MIIEPDIKLDFSDVLIVPKRSTLESRSQVELETKFKTLHGTEFSGVPIIAANMLTGTFDMLDIFSEQKMFVAIAKHNNSKWIKLIGSDKLKNYLTYGFYTIGMSDIELTELINFNKEYNSVTTSKNQVPVKICIDIANGYTQKFAKFVSKVRDFFPTNVIMAGNVCTHEMVQELIISGADIIKIGIGGGSECFHPDTLINAKQGLIKIKDIKINDHVLTHTNQYKKVLNVYKKQTDKLIIVNGNKSTLNHGYYIFEDNTFKWREAKDLIIDKHLLVKYNHEYQKINDILYEEYTGDVYDLEVEEDHSYVANDYIVHNCTTRWQTGVGYPQISAAISCADSAHGLGGMICLDGGMKNPGDVCKAFCANADFVMLGGMFAGTDECEGELITRYYKSTELEAIDKDISIDYKPIVTEKKFKLFYGMSSSHFQNLKGKIPDYAASEGRVEEVEYKGSVKDILKDLLGGIRSCGTYIGAVKLRYFGKCGSFIKTNKQHNRF
jgi:IMP dehydrogenase/GMP reductase